MAEAEGHSWPVSVATLRDQASSRNDLEANES